MSDRFAVGLRLFVMTALPTALASTTVQLFWRTLIGGPWIVRAVLGWVVWALCWYHLEKFWKIKTNA